MFHDVELKRKFYSPKFVLLVNNAIIHLHPESICFIMYYSKENFIVFFFLVNIVLSPLHQESICFMMSYSKENYIVQNFFSLWTMPYKEHFKISYHITYVLIRSWFDTLFIIWFEYFESNQFMIRASNQSLKQFVIRTRSTNHEASHMSSLY